MAMEQQLKQIGRRIRELRTLLKILPEEMAEIASMSVEEYLRKENGESDCSFSFLVQCAERFGVDLGDLVTGETPHLSSCTLVRANDGMPIRRRAGFEYLHRAALIKNRLTEPLVVTAPPVGDDKPIALSTHAGQEFDYILSGRLRFRYEDKEELLNPGDSVYYDSGRPHGMAAADGAPCEFIAIVAHGRRNRECEPRPVEEEPSRESLPSCRRRLVYHEFVTETIGRDGTLQDISFHYPDNFNFAYDVVDDIAARTPEKRAMRWISSTHEVRDFSFREIAENSCRTANFFASLGIRKGDRVMLVLRRHYQFWFAVLALHRIGAVVIPASTLMTEHDLVYRFNAAGVKAVVCTGVGEIADHVDSAQKESPSLTVKIVVNGEREGWHSFNREILRCPATFPRDPTLKANDPAILFFSSGTTGYPKMVLHVQTYPLGHICTARWWHCVDPDGLHLTISDTGWAKAMWGKIYGQWLCEGAILVYDFDRFHAADILQLFAEHRITTFCAPPTMYRFFVREDMSRYDYSSLRHACNAGEALNPEVFELFRKAAGLKLMEGFGQSESPILIGNLFGMTPKPGSMGRPVPPFRIDLLDSDGNKVAPGETGEICVRTEPYQNCGLFVGYYNDPELTRQVWHDGYYHTGDTAWMDEDGYFWYVGRVDDLIKSSGYRIGPFEIESVIMELPYVLEVAVTGAPDAIRGQVVKATIVLTAGKTPSDELVAEIQDYVRRSTAPYKYPRIVEFVPELPKTISGKIRRNALREQDRNRK